MLLAVSCAPGKNAADQSYSVAPLPETGTVTEGSIVYGLPRTVFTVTLEVDRTIEKPGPYAKYAGDFLGLSDVIQEENEYWTIEGITVESHDELDPSEFYVIKSNSAFQSNVLALKKEGLILDLNPRSFYPGTVQGDGIDKGVNELRTYDLGSDEYFQLQRDTAYRRVSVDSSFIRIPYIVEKKKRLSVDQLAEKAARRLMEMRDGKHLILTGEANVFPQNEAAIIEMNRLEKEYTELFTGKTWNEKRTFTYHFIPEKEMEGNPVTLFYFSELTGPSADLTGGKPVIAELAGEKKSKDLTIVDDPQADKDEVPPAGLFYRVPDVVNLKVSMGNENLFNSRRLIYQFGQVVQLPSKLILGK
jgi:hypothetical protein